MIVMSTLLALLAFKFYLCYDKNAFLETLLPGGGVNQDKYSALRINVGFLLHQSVGYNRKFEIDETSVQIENDLDVYGLCGDIRFTRTTQGLYSQSELTANTPLVCVRCLSNFDQELTIGINDLFVYPPQKKTDPLLTIPKSGILDLTGIVREYLLLEIPIQPMCGVGCQGLCQVCGKEQSEGQCDHPQSMIDPRFEILHTLLSKS
jgi:uncharacterized protein